MDALTRLQSLLRTLFQLDTADLDFGIYRLYHLKRREIDAFIDDQIPASVRRAFAQVTGEHKEALTKEVQDLQGKVRKWLGEEAVSTDGSVVDEHRKLGGQAVRELVAGYEAKRDALQRAEASEAQQIEVFNHLYAFFARYYEDGDFIPKRRYGSHETYAVPYDGQEVYLHWANKGQHYVKTGERLRDYAFNVEALGGPYRVQFRLVEATVPRENTKGDYRFLFPKPEEASYADRTFVLPFEYRPPTDKELARYGKNAKGQAAVLEEAEETIIEAVPEDVLASALRQIAHETDKEQVSLLLHRLRHFAKKQTSDYFVHQDLQGFLMHELEFYIKDQVLHLGDLQGDLAAKLRLIRVFRQVAGDVITFLDQMERVQCRLFEKKKFVLRTSYLCPIQHVPRELWPEVLSNEAQHAAWQQLYGIGNTVDMSLLAAHPTLVVDTAHFPAGFALALLASFEDIDEATDGLLVHGENYQALNVLDKRFHRQVKCIYIDPPYNTGGDDFPYKDRYRHSSWMAMMEERLRLAQAAMKDDGVLFVSIDDNEVNNLVGLCRTVFSEENIAALLIARTNPRGRTLDRYIAKTHEYILATVRTGDPRAIRGLPKRGDLRAEYSESDESGSYRLLGLRNRNPMFTRKNRPNLFYPIYADPDSGAVSLERTDRYTEEIIPRNQRGEDDCWTWSPERVARDNHLLVAMQTRTGDWRVFRKDYLVKDGRVAQTKVKSIWLEKGVNHERGKETVGDLFGRTPYDFPKSMELISQCLRIGSGRNHYILDFFAGSGTTGHAAVHLNREDGEERRFIMIEMADSFDKVILPRIQKVMYCPDWKDGQPVDYPQPSLDGMWPDWVERTPRLVKVLRLEAYEDSLHNLSTAETTAKEQERAEAFQQTLGAEAYRLRYLARLPLEASDTMLDVEKLEHPFSYTLEILTDEGPRESPVDLVETFSLLCGLRVKRLHLWENPSDGRAYRAVEGRRDDQAVLVVWRDMEGIDPAVERAFLEERVSGYDRVLINGDCAVPGIESLDPLFKRLMEARER